MQRVPVLSPEGIPLMPTKPSRARRWLRDGKARIYSNDLKVFAIQLTKPPSGSVTQPIAIGVDPGKLYLGVANATVTPAPFAVVRRPPVCRRQLHLLQFSAWGKRRKYGGTTTRHGVRKGDFVEATRVGKIYRGWASGDTATQVSVSDANWKRIGQFSARNVRILSRANGLLVKPS